MASRTAKTPARRYTETKVPILDSQLELKVLMEDARDVGLTDPEWEGGDGPMPVLRFRIDGRPCLVVLRPDEHEDDQEAELRRLHRVLLHFVKNAIEAARSRLFGVREALLAWHITTDGKMLGETVFAPGSAGRSVTLALPEAKAPVPSRTLPAAKAPAAPSRALPGAKTPAAPSRALPAAKAPAAPSRALLPGPTARRRKP
ncbi:MAG: hypothetical protein JNL82_35950 [Myxococcales bacterium]|nr:hypothetical protein [Myxococcales bacterium]